MLKYNEFIKRGEEIALGFDDIKAICRNDVNIVEFSDLAQIQSYQDLFRQNNRVILFWETKSEFIGHYNTLLYKSDNRAYGKTEYVEFFDSYGKNIDEVFALADYDYTIFNGINPLYRILKGIRVDQSKTRFQSVNQQIATCGRYASLRCRLYTMSNKEFVHFLTTSNEQPDKLVTSMTVLMSDISPLIVKRV